MRPRLRQNEGNPSSCPRRFPGAPGRGCAGAILAGGLHPEIKAEYFRIGHMGPTKLGDLLATIGALEAGLAACGYAFEKGAGVAAAMAAWDGQG